MNGHPFAGLHDPGECRGCRLGGGKGPPNAGGKYQGARREQAPEALPPVTFYGQIVESDTCYGFEPSFPHGFTGFTNFCDRYSGDRDRYFITNVDQRQIASGLRRFTEKNKDRLRDGKIAVWITDNGVEFDGDDIDACADELVRSHERTVANTLNKNPRAERDHGVIQRTIRCSLAHAEAPECLWSWAAYMAYNVLQYLATTIHDPPQSVYHFLNPQATTVEMGWAHVLFCDVTIHLPERDRAGKVANRAADACYLGYDPSRRCHFCYCPTTHRIGSYQVSDWRSENKFSICKTLSSDTPVEYHQLDDLPMSPETAAIVPKRLAKTRQPRVASRPLPQVAPQPPPPRPVHPLLPAQYSSAEARDGQSFFASAFAAIFSAGADQEGEGGLGDFAINNDEMLSASAQEQITADRDDPIAAKVFAMLAEMKANKDIEIENVLDIDSNIPYMLAPEAMAAAANIDLPKTVQEGIGTPQWPMIEEAMEHEIRGKFIENQAWEVVKRESWMHVLKGRWVLAWKINEDGSIKGVKARFVACGYGQVKNEEYTEVFAKTLSSLCFKLFCTIVVDEDLCTDQMDAFKAFTQPYVDCDLYVEMPFGFTVQGFVLKLIKALEGIKQGANLWFKMNKAALESLGCVPSLTEPNLYQHNKLRITTAVFADDIANGYHESQIDEYRRFRKEYAALIKLGSGEITPMAIFIGIECNHNRQEKTMTLTQTRYLEKAVEKYKHELIDCDMPYINASAFEKMAPAEEGDRIEATKMLALLGVLLWVATWTRPDVLFAVCFLCSFAQTAGPEHYRAGIVILSYLYKTKRLGIRAGGKLKVPLGLKEFPPGFRASSGLHTYSDSSWGKNPKPFAGYCVMRSNLPLIAVSRRLKFICDSTAEAEMAIASKASKETVAVQIVSEEIKRPVVKPTPILIDSQAARDSIVKPGATARTRFFERAITLIKRLYMLLMVMPHLIPTSLMVADIFTKAVDKNTFERMQAYLLNMPDENSNLCRECGGYHARGECPVKNRSLSEKAKKLVDKLLDMYP